MAFFRWLFLFIAMIPIFFLAMPGQAQTSATLNVSVRVVEQCVISSAEKRRLARLVRKTGRRIDISQRCSKGVVSRVSERPINRTILRPTVPLPRRISREKVARRTAAGRSDVYLVTVTY